jgi:hypothetical protein
VQSEEELRLVPHLVDGGDDDGTRQVAETLQELLARLVQL